MSTKAYREANKARIAENARAYRIANREKIAEAAKAAAQRLREEEPEKYRERERRRARRRQASGAKTVQKRKWRERNQERVRATKRDYYHSTPERRLASLLRMRVNNALSGRKKGGSAVDLLGVGLDEARVVIERQFQRGMTWENWGDVWHLDHVRPLAAFDLADVEQLAQACHITNLRPLPKAANLSKGAKLEFLL